MSEKYTYTCIVCPVSCRVTITENEKGEFTVEGNTCKRGEKFAYNEHTDPRRMLTSTVKIEGGELPRLPVISNAEVPKRELKECLELLYGMEVKAPVKCGDVVMSDIRGLGVDIVASRSMEKKAD